MEDPNNLHHTQPTLVVPAEPGHGPNTREATLVQFPRRVFLLLLAFGGAILLIWGLFLLAGDSGSLQSPPVSDELVNGAASTLSLLLTSLLLALLLALLLTGTALLERRIQAEVGRSGLLLRFGSRLLIFGLLSPPVLLLGLLFRWLLLANIHAATPGPISPALLDAARFPAMAVVLALLPALLAAQATTRRAVLYRPARSPAATGLTLLANLFRQTGGILSAITVLEVVFSRPGLGNLLLLSYFHGDTARLPRILSLLAVLILAGLLLAELCDWGAQLLSVTRKPAKSKVRRPGERRFWIGIAMWLLLIPLGLAAGGLVTQPQQALRQDIERSDQPPSPAYPLGTDSLGRDMKARALRAGLSTVRRSSGIAALSLIPGFFLGIVAGALAGREEWRWETVADLLLLPLDLLLFLPVIPGTIAIMLLLGTSGGPFLILVPALLLLPRVAHATRTIWEARALERRAAWDMLVGLSALFLAVLFISFSILIALEYVGLGPQPPLPALGGLLQDGRRTILTNPEQLAAIVAMVIGYSVAFYAAADAMLDGFNTKQAMADLNR